MFFSWFACFHAIWIIFRTITRVIWLTINTLLSLATCQSIGSSSSISLNAPSTGMNIRL